MWSVATRVVAKIYRLIFSIRYANVNRAGTGLRLNTYHLPDATYACFICTVKPYLHPLHTAHTTQCTQCTHWGKRKLNLKKTSKSPN